MGIESNIWKLQADRFLSNFWIYVSILVPFFEANGLSPTQIFMTEAIFAIVVATMEIPTGYLSDRIGRKACFILGSALIPTGLAIYTFFHSFGAFACAEAILGLGISFRSGTDSSFLYDTLIELKREKEHKNIEGSALFFKDVGNGVANIMGGLLAVISLTLPFYVNVAISLLMVPLAFSMKEPKRESKKSQNAKAHLKDMGRAVKYSAKHDILRNASLYAAFINGLGIIGYWLNYLYYGKIGIGVAYFGFLAAGCSLAAAFGSKMLYRIDRKLGEKITLGLPILMGACMCTVGLLQSVWAIPFILCNSFLWGLSVPLLQNILHKNTRSDVRATVLSLSSMGGRLVFVVLSVGIGSLVDATSVHTSLICLGTLLITTTTLPAWNLIRAEKE
ncbi:MAG: MFS transporter [Alphaproteobacteria bacterium]|nr:MFS transporter [Alphaproteobacteria bacterium]